MPDKKFDLGDYVEVKDRITKFYELYGNGRLVTGEVTLTSEPDGKPRVMVQALAYRNPEDPHPGVGYSWMELPGKTTYTAGSELENTETSAWGRAIASLGILNDKSIASAQEIANKQEGAGSAGTSAEGAGGPPAPQGETVTALGPKRVTGEVVKGGEAHQGKWKQGIDGPAIGFKLKLDGDDRDIPQVNVAGDLGRGLSLLLGEDPLIGLRVTVKGTLYNVRPSKGGSFYRLVAEHAEHDVIEGPFGRVPASPELLEAPSEPLFTDEEAAAIVAAELAEATA